MLMLTGFLIALMLPVKGLIGIFKKIAEMAEAELTDESKIREGLVQLEDLYDNGKITEEEYHEREDQLMERLNMARENKDE
ncbi:hypothetical protein KSC_097820 [Ktedonobacter sp. SOSP1-52]|uniref:gas vesicle protein GvpG n=1 Tax=Ktedonobacter sp. SOSP1-52 TaxID=2778366 RepID=UPI0019167D2D|nr:gas vesicle protein GvpG [Ktedonobacter sp. SOSP1-52]GHO70890.1 hypothetical protein KSC_097820 [Ktedonobacter sp. SOSP1-52]